MFRKTKDFRKKVKTNKKINRSLKKTTRKYLKKNKSNKNGGYLTKNYLALYNCNGPNGYRNPNCTYAHEVPGHVVGAVTDLFTPSKPSKKYTYVPRPHEKSICCPGYNAEFTKYNSGRDFGKKCVNQYGKSPRIMDLYQECQ